VITLLDHTDAVMSIAWSPDELRLGTSSGDRSIRVRPSASGLREPRTSHVFVLVPFLVEFIRDTLKHAQLIAWKARAKRPERVALVSRGILTSLARAEQGNAVTAYIPRAGVCMADRCGRRTRASAT